MCFNYDPDSVRMEHLEHGLEQHLRFNMAANGTAPDVPSGSIA